MGIANHLKLQLRPNRPQVLRTVGESTNIDLNIEAAHTDRTMAFRTQMEFVLNPCPGFLQSISLLGMPFGAIYLLTGLGGTSPKTTKHSHANIHNIARGAHRGANSHRVSGPVALLAGKTEGKVPLTLIAYILINIGNYITLRHKITSFL